MSWEIKRNAIRRRVFFLFIFGSVITVVLILHEQESSPRELWSPFSSRVTHDNTAPDFLQNDTHTRQNVSNTANKNNVTEVCNTKYESTFEANLEYIRAYNLSAALPYMEKLNLTKRPLLPSDQSNVRVPVFVTACSSNHFKLNMELMENIDRVVRPVFKNLKIIVYDLGLKRAGEVEQLSAACRCDIRRFPFPDAPTFFKHVKGCPWKPIVIQMALREYPFVMWMDSSVRFTTGNLQPLFDKALSSGIVQIIRTKGRPPSVSLETHQETFEFLNEPPCLYHKEIMLPAGFIVLYPKDPIFDGILNPWTKCALIEECIWTTRPIREILKCPQNASVTAHRCHRYDQSVLNILMKRLFHDDIENHLVAEGEYAYFRNPKREEKIHPVSYTLNAARKYYETLPAD